MTTPRPDLGPGHATWTGTRDMRCADSVHRPMYFARCQCGAEGPSRISRADADQGQRALTHTGPLAEHDEGTSYCTSAPDHPRDGMTCK